MQQAISLAKKQQVKVGAHPSFPDKANFGRKVMEIPLLELQNSIYQQISDFQTVCQQLNVKMHHIKLHGALYNLAAQDPEIAAMVLNAFAAAQAEVRIYVPYGSVIAMFAEDYFNIIYEVFIDRRYHSDLSLVSRSDKNAVISDASEAWQQMSEMIHHGVITSIEGDKIPIKADTYCIHGDQANAIEIIKYIRQCL
jgi:UPF0271 protein